MPRAMAAPEAFAFGSIQQLKNKGWVAKSDFVPIPAVSEGIPD